MVSSPTEQQQHFHELAVKHFLASGISYKFNACIVPLPEDGDLKDIRRRAPCPKGWSRFIFSKPTMQQPEPKVVITMDVETLEERADGSVVYSMLPEGQTLRRPLIFEPKSPKTFFCEELLDNVYNQKMATMEKYGM
jgi:hypothetical protein